LLFLKIDFFHYSNKIRIRQEKKERKIKRKSKESRERCLKKYDSRDLPFGKIFECLTSPGKSDIIDEKSRTGKNL
ncbi:MAG: hypothetical protein ACI4V1_04100, partial [Eubacteriales bacterium]